MVEPCDFFNLPHSCSAIWLGNNLIVICLIPCKSVISDQERKYFDKHIICSQNNASYLMNDLGINRHSGHTFSGHCHTVFPLRLPLSRPNNIVALVRPDPVKVQFLITLVVFTTWCSSSSCKCAMMVATWPAFLAFSTCSFVPWWFFWTCSTIIIKVFAVQIYWSGVIISMYGIPLQMPTSCLSVNVVLQGEVTSQSPPKTYFNLYSSSSNCGINMRLMIPPSLIQNFNSFQKPIWLVTFEPALQFWWSCTPVACKWSNYSMAKIVWFLAQLYR